MNIISFFSDFFFYCSEDDLQILMYTLSIVQRIMTKNLLQCVLMNNASNIVLYYPKIKS